MGHHRASSCSAIPSYFTITSDSTENKSTKSSINSEENLHPSFCLYSKKALTNEYGLESDIIQFLSPETDSLKEQLPVFVGILQSLFTVVKEMPFSHTCSEEEITDAEDEDDFDNDPWSPFTIIGLDTMKLVIWPNMYNNCIIQESAPEKDLCLVVIVSSLLQDDKALRSMDLLRESLEDMPVDLKGQELGQELIPLISHWFEK